MAQLPLQNFIQNQTVVHANWLNQVDLLSHVMAADATGHTSIAAPTSTVNTPALQINGAAIAGGSGGDLLINTVNGVGLGISSATAPFSQLYVKNTLNSTTSFTEFAMQADGTSANFNFQMVGSANTSGLT